MDNNKKTLLNSKIEVEELEKYSKIITKKALKVISCSGSIYALKLLENKDIDTLNDLYQEVSLQLILDNYIVTRNAFRVVRSFIYKNYEKTETEIFTTEEEETRGIENASYMSFLSNSNEDTKKASKIDVKKLMEKLSKKEKEVYKYYFVNNMQQVNIYKMMEVKQQTVGVLIKRIKEKARKCLVMEV